MPLCHYSWTLDSVRILLSGMDSMLFGSEYQATKLSLWVRVRKGLKILSSLCNHHHVVQAKFNFTTLIHFTTSFSFKLFCDPSTRKSSSSGNNQYKNPKFFLQNISKQTTLLNSDAQDLHLYNPITLGFIHTTKIKHLHLHLVGNTTMRLYAQIQNLIQGS